LINDLAVSAARRGLRRAPYVRPSTPQGRMITCSTSSWACRNLWLPSHN